MANQVPLNLQDELGKRNPFDALEQEAYLNLVRTANRIAIEFRRLFKTHGLTEPQYNVLRILAGAGDTGKRCEGIGGEMITPAPDVTRLVDRLVASELAERETDTRDRRAVIIRITPAGRDLLARMHDPVLDLHRRQLATLSPQKLAVLNDLLFEARWGQPPSRKTAASDGDAGRESGAPTRNHAADFNPSDREG